jgi:hypothetical protein
MLHNAILLENLVEHLQGAPAIHHEIFRDDFEPVYNRFFLEDMLVVRNAKANANAVVRLAVKSVRRHKEYYFKDEVEIRLKSGRTSRHATGPPTLEFQLFGCRFTTVFSGITAALAFARILSFAAVVATLTAALACAGVFAFARVLFFLNFGCFLTGVALAGFVSGVLGHSRGGCASNKPGQGRANQQCSH